MKRKGPLKRALSAANRAAPIAIGFWAIGYVVGHGSAPIPEPMDTAITCLVALALSWESINWRARSDRRATDEHFEREVALLELRSESISAANHARCERCKRFLAEQNYVNDGIGAPLRSSCGCKVGGPHDFVCDRTGRV